MSQLNQYRREYTLATLDESQLTDTPMPLFQKWFNEAVEAGVPDPNAMTVATVDAAGQPSMRIVLLKDYDEKGFVFYTNLGSRKAKELALNPNIALHFPWHFMERQVRVCGRAEALTRTEVASYFLSRPRDSQLAAIASKQSQPISTKQLLLTQFAQLKEKFKEGDIPLPDFWGGFRVVPQQIEFWQGGEHRLHDRFEYSQQPDASWSIARLNP